jgi:hypothetical protein
MNVATTPHFASILDEAPTEVVRPKPLPEGTYLCVVGQPEAGKSSQKKTPFVKFPLRPVAALDDVDDAALSEVDGLEGKNLSITFYITPDAIFMLDQFHEHCGINLSDPASRSIRNQEVVNSQVLAVVTHRMSEDNTQAFAEVRRTAVAE